MAGRNEVDLSELEDYRALSLDQRNAFKVRAPKADITEPDPFRASRPIATIAVSCLGATTMKLLRIVAVLATYFILGWRFKRKSSDHDWTVPDRIGGWSLTRCRAPAWLRWYGRQY